MRYWMILIFGLSIVACGETDPNAWRTADNRLLAYNEAAPLLRQQLKSPSEAEFPGFSEKQSHVIRVGSLENQTYEINSWVDAKNSFGGTVRTHWQATIRFTGPDTFEIGNVRLIE